MNWQPNLDLHEARAIHCLLLLLLLLPLPLLLQRLLLLLPLLRLPLLLPLLLLLLLMLLRLLLLLLRCLAAFILRGSPKAQSRPQPQTPGSLKMNSRLRAPARKGILVSNLQYPLREPYYKNPKVPFKGTLP